jgi:hypothetical protein
MSLTLAAGKDIDHPQNSFDGQSNCGKFDESSSSKTTRQFVRELGFGSQSLAMVGAR